MRGRIRTRKKQMLRAGWRVVGEGRAADRGYVLALQAPDGEELAIAAGTRQHAYLRAQKRIREHELQRAAAES